MDSPHGYSRRRFLACALGLGSLATATVAGTGTVPAEPGDPNSVSGLPVLPPGARDRTWFAGHCTGCQLCVAACPAHVLSFRAGPGPFQPGLCFADGYCRADCTICTRVCPTSALQPLEARVKKRLQLGRAVLRNDLCLVQREGRACTECVRHCPATAIMLVGAGEVRMPMVDTALCTGCGACEYHCPVQPKAIRVDGNAVQVRL